MVAMTDVNARPPQLRHGALNLPGTLGQSIANIAPTITPALNISVVAGLAGVGSWLSYLIATLGCVFVGSCIAALARRHPEAGSYFVYIGRNFGPVTGALAGWLMILAYLTCAAAVMSAFPLFLGNFLSVFHRTLPTPLLVAFAVIFLALVAYAAYRDIRLSSRLGLALETISIGIIIVIIAIVVAQHGTVIDPKQLDVAKLPFGGVMSAMAFAVFSFVGFESAATLAKESGTPRRNVPLALMGSVVAVGLFFTVMAYFVVLGMNDNAGAIGNSGSPFTDMTAAAHLPWAGAVVYLAAMISAFACALASINAGARMIYSMGRYQFLHRTLGRVHRRHETPHAAVIVSAFVVLVLFLCLLGQGFLNAYNETGTICSYGFVLVYLGVAVAAAVDLQRAGALKVRHVAASGVGAALMLFVIYSSVVPYPAAPDEYLPEIFAGYVLAGLGWFWFLKLRSPAVLAGIADDMEG